MVHHSSSEPPDCCSLCGHREWEFYHRDSRRSYWECLDCHLVQVPPDKYLSADAEKAEYDLHDNNPDDSGYRRFLTPAAEAVKTYCPLPARVLDFGCGPGPALAAMLSEAGYETVLYDWFYYPDETAFSGAYEAITATEVVEHLHAPGEWLHRLWECLQPGGVLVVQTKRVISQEHFRDWHYIRDNTHVAFFSIATLSWLARRWSATLRLTRPDVAVFHKP